MQVVCEEYIYKNKSEKFNKSLKIKMYHMKKEFLCLHLRSKQQDHNAQENDLKNK